MQIRTLLQGDTDYWYDNEGGWYKGNGLPTEADVSGKYYQAFRDIVADVKIANDLTLYVRGKEIDCGASHDVISLVQGAENKFGKNGISSKIERAYFVLDPRMNTFVHFIPNNPDIFVFSIGITKTIDDMPVYDLDAKHLTNESVTVRLKQHMRMAINVDVPANSREAIVSIENKSVACSSPYSDCRCIGAPSQAEAPKTVHPRGEEIKEPDAPKPPPPSSPRTAPSSQPAPEKPWGPPIPRKKPVVTPIDPDG